MPFLLSETHQRTLVLLIEEYLETRQPVSSFSMGQKTGKSSATMRAWMSNMEEQGYLASVHTSSGRRPTPRTLVWYAQNLPQQSNSLPLTPSDWEILGSLEHIGYHREYVGQVLSDLCQCTSVMFIAPQSMRIQSVQLIPLSGTKLMCVWQTLCQNTMYRVVDYQPVAAVLMVLGLEVLMNYLNTLVQTRTVEQVVQLLAYPETPLERLSAYIVQNGYQTLEGKIDVKGHGYLLDSFSDKGSMAHCREVFSWLETKEHVTRVLQRAIDHPTHQRWQILWYHNDDDMWFPDYCILIAPYYSDDQQGAVSVIGPWHMDYRRIIPIMKHMVHLVERSLK